MNLKQVFGSKQFGWSIATALASVVLPAGLATAEPASDAATTDAATTDTSTTAVARVSADTADTASIGSRIDLSKFKMTWNDEFDGERIDPTKWDLPTQIRQGASRWRPELAGVRDGTLVLAIRKSDDPTYRYDSAAVRTRKDYDPNQTFFEQQYGYFETRCKFPRHIDADYWGAFWMMSGRIADDQPSSRLGTEIDILETFTFRKDAEYNLAFHWSGYGKNHNATALKAGTHPQALDGEFHTYGLYWDQDKYVAFFDGAEAGRINMVGLGEDHPLKPKSDGTARVPAYLKLSCEAAPWAGKSHLWDEQMPDSDEFVVDYVRVYQGRLEDSSAEAGQ